MFCSNCGKQIPDGSAFCPNCGAQLGGAQPQQSQPPQPQQQQMFQEPADQQPKAKGKLVPFLAAVAVVILAAVLILPRLGGKEAPVTVTVPTSPYDATELPQAGEYAWTVAYFRDGLPEGARVIKDYSEITGTWKGWIIHNRNQSGKEAVEFFTAGIGNAASEAALVADWYQLYYLHPSKLIDETGDPDTVFTGSWNKGVLTVSAGGKTVTLTAFYEVDGTQYAYGAIEGKGESESIFALSRP